MVKMTSRTLGAAIVAGSLLALPAVASASPLSAAEKVVLHTDRADGALERAVSLFGSGEERPAVAALNRSRAELGKAAAAAAKLVRQADTPAERVAAAKAIRLVATQRDENVAELAGLLDEVDAPGAERAVAKAALADVTGREKAISVLQGLIAKGMPAKAEIALTRAIAKLSTERDEEFSEAAEAVAEGEVSPEAAAVVTRAIDASLRGQERAAATITALMGTVPAAAKPGLEHALAAIAGERQSVATGLERAAGHMPELVRALVDGIVQRVLGGPPAGTPDGPPAGTPDGPPAGTPDGPPAGTPDGPPAGLPVPIPGPSIPVPSIPVDLPFGPGGLFG